ncbi:carbohydrate ABC transporter permease [Rhodoglobus aureus]|uniref:Carbohydrate ABC transporter permease n=1 Tax=Rhodoglobus aureus TaxID=191497 RepID=A0ABN1VIZ4_9MICO
MNRLKMVGRRRMVPAALATVVFLIPVYWMLITSLKQREDVFSRPPSLIPLPPTLDSYIAAFADASLTRALLNTLIIAVGTTIITLVVALPASYGLARLNIPFLPAILMLFLVVQMVPSVNLALPLFALFSSAGLVNTFAGLIIANASLAIPLAITIMRPYFLAVPNDVIEAAKTDGCNNFTAFLRIALPVSSPGIVTVGVITFLGAWGEFVFGLALATREDLQPVTVVIAGLTNEFGIRWNDLMAASTIIALPVIIAFIFLQRYIVAGLTEGATKS